jgi:dihydroflavonol-4-reductase
MSNHEPSNTVVTVTGASGFIALHCVRELLERGYRVRGTVRDLASETSLRQALLPFEAGDRLSFVAAELLSDAGWAEAMHGARYVLHVASPVPNAPPKDEQELIRPAREGALRVLRAAREAGVSRVVLTSSVAAVLSGRVRDRGHVFDEKDWSDLDRPMGAYDRSKTLAEKAAWDFVREPAAHTLELVALNPVFVLGPSLRGTDNTSNEIVGKLMRREVPGVPRVQFGLVDVRDVARAHVLAMTTKNAAGERFILGSDTAWMKQIADVLAEAGYKVPTRELPNFLVRLVALFDPTVRLIVDVLGMPFLTSSEKAQSVLGWSGRSMKEMVLDTARGIAAKKRTASR